MNIKATRLRLATLILAATTCMMTMAQEIPGWDLVWQDEFTQANGTPPDSTKWGYDIGGGGWGNNEWQYYTSRTNNARIENNQLVIEAHEESYGGRDYTSARLLTKNKWAWTYGRMEARIKVPYGQGIWPAFWMLGADIGSVGWPNCGEIDIMEHIGKEPQTIYGTIHGPGYSGGASFGGSINIGEDVTDNFHVFAVEWDENLIKWYMDGTLYHAATPASVAPDDWVFDHPFFFILNVAVGGQWPGYPDGSTVFPQQMLVDYVRVYSSTNTTPSTSTPFGGTPMDIPGIIQAEQYDNGGQGVAYYDTDFGNNGNQYRDDDVDIEVCTDTGGGHNVGWTANGEWMKYTVNVAPAGEYTVTARVARGTGGSGAFHIEVDGANVTGSISVPATGDWQNWTTVTAANVTLSSGEQVVEIVIDSGDININLLEFVLDQELNDPPVFTSDTISKANAAEDVAYTGQTMDGDATDANGDPLSYSLVPGGPGWLNMATNGTLSGVPENADVGLNSWTVQVSDGINSPVTATLEITVDNVNDAPVFTTDPIIRPNGQEGSGYIRTIAGSATDVDAGDSLSYSKVSGPDWLNVATNGLISGVPGIADVGTKNWTVQVEDGNGGTDTATLIITIEGTTTLPSLSIQVSGSNLEILWPASTTGFSLYGSTTLTSPIVWSSVTNTPIIQGDDWMVTLPIVGAPQFFLLKNP